MKHPTNITDNLSLKMLHHTIKSDKVIELSYPKPFDSDFDYLTQGHPINITYPKIYKPFIP